MKERITSIKIVNKKDKFNISFLSIQLNSTSKMKLETNW
jgi:hypothetical protein